MKRSLRHLPAHKREELEEIVSIIRDVVDVEMIILFGGDTRGGWVEDASSFLQVILCVSFVPLW